VTWLTWLWIAALIAAIAAVTGIKPTGTRPVARTRLMGIARVALAVIALILFYIIFRSRAG
jgi:hypothetical protein